MVSASGGDGACVPGCQECKEQRRCAKCNSGYTWDNYQCLSSPGADEPLVKSSTVIYQFLLHYQVLKVLCEISSSKGNPL